jgi:ADP-ribosyl-[dinitrogen reductase] hydrolase
LRPNIPVPTLEIATLQLQPGKGMLGITHCPGRCQPDSDTGSKRRELAADLAAIRAWGATVLVTLIEAHEFEQLKVDHLGEMAEAVGLEWHHLPIPDMDVPDWRFGQRWIYSGLRLRRHLRQGGRVVLHCRAGLGRAGTIAAHLLVELGMPAAEAVSQVRKVRRGAIQTGAQEAHVQKVAHVGPRRDEDMARRLACLLGGALGDGFGHPVEYDKLAAIQRRFGADGLRLPQYEHGQLVVSDETQLTLFTLEGLIRARLAREDDDGLIRQVRLSYLDWLETQGGKASGNAASRLMKHAALYVRRASGNACLEALEAGAQGTPQHPINDCRDSGGVMRIAPVALLPGVDAARAFNLGMRAAALTHGHPSGYLPAGILAATLRLLLDGLPFFAAVQQARELARPYPGHEESLAKVDAAVNAARHPHLGQIPLELGLGWVAGEALAIALYAAARSLDFNTVMALAANHDGDSDTTAAIAGQLFAAQYGLEALPHAWVRRLDILDALCDVVDWGQPLWGQAAA